MRRLKTSTLCSGLILTLLLVGPGLSEPTAEAKKRKGRRVAAGKKAAKKKRGKKPKTPDPAPAGKKESNPSPGKKPRTGMEIEGTRPVSTSPMGNRVEYDSLTVLGQTKASGAVYLFERKASNLRSLVKRRTSYRKELRRQFKTRRGP